LRRPWIIIIGVHFAGSIGPKCSLLQPMTAASGGGAPRAPRLPRRHQEPHGPRHRQGGPRMVPHVHQRAPRVLREDVQSGGRLVRGRVQAP